MPPGWMFCRCAQKEDLDSWGMQVAKNVGAVLSARKDSERANGDVEVKSIRVVCTH